MSEPLCIQCKLPALSRCHSDDGRREVYISGMCEVCFDALFEEDNDGGDCDDYEQHSDTKLQLVPSLGPHAKTTADDMRCPSTSYGRQCDQPYGHVGLHCWMFNSEGLIWPDATLGPAEYTGPALSNALSVSPATLTGVEAPPFASDLAESYFHPVQPLKLSGLFKWMLSVFASMVGVALALTAAYWLLCLLALKFGGY